MISSSVRPFRSSLLLRRLFSSDSVDPIQAGYLAEPCIEVDQQDEPIGRVTKKDCHLNPILHRAFSAFIFNSDKKLLLQKRSSTKITFPAVWTNSCCSHPHFSDTEIAGEKGIKIAAKRKLKHELGIDTHINQMSVMGRFIYKANSDDVWVEHELDYAICIPNFDTPIKPNSEEVSEFKFVTQYELDEMFADKKFTFSPWFSLFSSFQWLNLWWNDLDKLDSLKDSFKIHKLN